MAPVSPSPVPSSDWGTSCARGPEADDAAERRAGRPLRSAYLSIIGVAPLCRAGDRGTAAGYVAKLRKAVSKGGWTRNEWRRLNRALDLWERRTRGEDARFNVIGNHKTGLTPTQRDRVAMEELGIASRMGIEYVHRLSKAISSPHLNLKDTD